MTDGVIVLDKPQGMTSFRAVQSVGRIFPRRKCGHAGTLDPLATGVLPVCVGTATKIAGYLALQEKEYRAGIRFGEETDTGDAAGRVTEAQPGASAAEDRVRAAVAALVGSWEQVPPAHSAIKVDGTRSYVLARKGQAVALAPRRVTVYEARLESWTPEGFVLFLRCTKGFYVRALPRDLREALGVPMTVAALRRLRVGPFREEDAVPLDVLVEEGRRGAAASRLVPIPAALSGFPQWDIPDDAVAAVRNGKSPGPWLGGRELPGEQEVALLTHPSRGPVALVSRGSGGLWKIVRGI